MKTVRFKLVALVLGCLTPAVVGAVLSERASEAELLEQAGRRVDGANRRFESELEEYQKNARLALVFAGQSQRLQQAVAEGDRERVSRFVGHLGAVYQHRTIIIADARGATLAGSNVERGPASLGPEASEAFTALLANQEVHGLVPLRLPSGPSYGLIAAAPIEHEGKQVGAIALITPITPGYLSYLDKKLNADLAILVNGKLIAATADHPAPHIHSSGADVTLEDEAGKLFAVKTFHPALLQRPGLTAQLTASRDVTEVRDTERKALLAHLAALGAVLLVVLALALRFAGRLARSVQSVSHAASEVKAGRYTDAEVIRSGDELEALAVDFNEMVKGLKERDHLKETFGRYVTRQVADHLMKGNQNLGGELVPVTILFSDIRSFTSISETMEPRALLDFLNEYFSGMVESVLTHHGVVDKFIGDAIMAVFGAPVPEPDDPLHAVKAALEMRSRLEAINADFKERGLPEIRTGIGLHSGQVVAGNMGHSERMEYTVIGDAVNLASRLEGMTKELGCDVILSEDLYLQVQNEVAAEPLRKIKVKGRDQEVMVYRLIGLHAAPVAAA